MKKVYLSLLIISAVLSANQTQASSDLNLELPATLMSFSIVANGEYINLDWTTIDEVNCDYYLIQRSRDQVYWFDVSTVDAAGNSNNPVDYSFVDQNPLPGSAFYRLVEIDTNGDSEILAIDKVEIVVISDIEIYPNPTDTEVFLEVEGGTEGLDVIVKDLAGNEIQINPQRSGFNKMKLRTSDLENGIYIVKIQLGSQVITKKIIVNHNR